MFPALQEEKAAMLKTDAVAAGDHHFVLTSLAPGAAQKRFALCIVLGLLVALYLITGPLAGIQLGEVTAFVAVYATAMFVTDAITAILLYAQYSILRSRAILVIASGYLFTALIVVPYTLAFPNVLTPAGSIGGLQTVRRAVRHVALRFSAVRHRLCAVEGRGSRQAALAGTARMAILRSVAWTVAAAAAGAYSMHQRRGISPANDARFCAASAPSGPTSWGCRSRCLCSTALVVLWIRRRSILDLWLMVVMCLYLIEVPLSYYPIRVASAPAGMPSA